MTDPQFDLDLKALADKYQVHIKGKATPLKPDVDAFDISAEATPAPDVAPVAPVNS